VQAALQQALQQQDGSASQEAAQLARQAHAIDRLTSENRELVAKLTSLHSKMRSYKASAARKDGELRGRDAEVGGEVFFGCPGLASML
jgi:cell division protein FtsB